MNLSSKEVKAEKPGSSENTTCSTERRDEGTMPSRTTSQERSEPNQQSEIGQSVADRNPSHRRSKQRRKAPETNATSCVAASYSRMSSALQREASIEGQQRKNRETAQSNGHKISPEFEFSDSSVSGTKRERAGLNEMLDEAKRGKFGTLYLYSLSRLARESVLTLSMLKRLVHTYRVRVISITEGIDSDRDGWCVHWNCR